MSIRPFYLFSLIIGGMLALALFWLVHWHGPALRNSWTLLGIPPPHPHHCDEAG